MDLSAFYRELVRDLEMYFITTLLTSFALNAVISHHPFIDENMYTETLLLV